jgi:PD-(D/E)XK endonuclease
LKKDPSPVHPGAFVYEGDSVQDQQQKFEERQLRIQAERDTKKRGELSELAFVYKAASLGFCVARPYGDSDRFDFIVIAEKHFWRVQVKSSRTLRCGKYIINAQRHLRSGVAPYTADEIDFLAAYIIPEDSWLIIPVKAFVPRTVIRVYPKGGSRTNEYSEYREAWWRME